MLIPPALLAAAGVFGVAWYYTEQINDGAFKVKQDLKLPYDLVTRSAGEGVVALSPASDDARDDWQQDGVFGLEWEGGYAQVGKILDRHRDEVVRELRSGTAPKAGTKVRLDSFAFQTSRSNSGPVARGVSLQEVSVQTPLGPAPAWYVPGTRDTWAVFVHGHRSSREEALRLLPTVTQQGFHALIITYRNDAQAPLSPDKQHRFGETEWQDLAAAMDYAQSKGARRFLLVGYSMGGGIVMALMQQQKYAPMVGALILDAPMLDMGRTLDFRAERRGLPQLLTDVAKALAERRFEVDWSDLDYLSHAKDLKAPVLLFHGEADTVVPIATSTDLALQRPDVISYVKVPETGHVRAWNTDPAAYEAAVRSFLLRVLP